MCNYFHFASAKQLFSLKNLYRVTNATIGSAVFAGLTVATNTRADTLRCSPITTHSTVSVIVVTLHQCVQLCDRL